MPTRPPSRVACTSPTPSPRTADAAPLALAAVAHIRHIRRSASIRRIFRHELNCGLATFSASITAAAAPRTHPRVRVSARRFESCCRDPYSPCRRSRVIVTHETVEGVDESDNEKVNQDNIVMQRRHEKISRLVQSIDEVAIQSAPRRSTVEELKKMKNRLK
jgi:hypothetical protein